jgi:hypothetical protein
MVISVVILILASSDRVPLSELSPSLKGGHTSKISVVDLTGFAPAPMRVFVFGITGQFVTQTAAGWQEDTFSILGSFSSVC